MPDKQRILIVDDDPHIIYALRVRLQAAGFEVIEAHDGVEGLKAARTLDPSALILDIRLPGLDGLTVLNKLKEEYVTSKLPVIVLSASSADERRALDNRASYFVSKPYDSKMLLAALDSALAMRNPRPKEISTPDVAPSPDHSQPTRDP